jgi:hypothetical protein
MNARTKIKDLKDVGLRLAALVEQENEVLAAMRPQEIRSLQQEKAQLTRAYEELLRSFAEDGDD